MKPIPPNPSEILRAIPLFAKLTDAQIDVLAKLMVPEHHHPLSQIVRQGDLGNRFFVIAAGTVSMRRTTAGGAESVVGGLTASPVGKTAPPRISLNYFGEQMFSSQEPYDFHADAVTEVDVFRFHREDFDELVKAQKHILHALDFIKAAERKRTYGFEWVGEGETVILRVHKHWWALVPSVALPVVLLIPAALAVPMMRFFSLAQYAYVPLLLVLGILTLTSGVKVIEWLNDEYIVTNQRVAHVERNFLYQQELRDTSPIDKVQGVVVERSGPVDLILGVAKLIIQTPGREHGNITFDYIGNAEKVREAILRLQESNRARIAAEGREQFRSTVRSELRQYLAPDLPEVMPPVKPLVRKKRRKGIFGILLAALGAPFTLEVRTDDRITWRKHWALFLDRSKKWLAVQLGIIALFGMITYTGGWNTACLSISIGIFLGAMVPVIYEWMDWRNDIYAVTETHIIDSERAPFGLKEKTSVAPLDQITDVVYDYPHFIATFLDYGTLKIDTAGKTGQMIFESIHNPRFAQEEIYRRIAAFKSKRVREDASIRSASVVDAILAYHRLQQDKEREDQAQAYKPISDAEPDSSDGSPRVWKPDEPKPGSESSA